MDRFPARVTRAVIFGAVCWTLAIVFFAGQAVAQSASARPYSLATNLISDLGNTSCGPDICSPWHGLMDAVLVLVGAFHVSGALTTYRAWPHPRASAIGLWLLVVAGAGLGVAGLAPDNVAPTAHAAGALVGLVSLNVAMIVLGSALWGAVLWLGLISLLAGGVGLLGFGFLILGVDLPAGVAERIADYPAAAVVVLFGGFLLASATLSRRRAGWSRAESGLGGTG